MIRVYCENGSYRDKMKEVRPCTYSREYPDSALAELVHHVKTAGMGGFHCPVCRKHPMKSLKKKDQPSIDS